MPAEVVGGGSENDLCDMTLCSPGAKRNYLDFSEFYARSLSLMCSDAQYAQVVFGVWKIYLMTVSSAVLVLTNVRHFLPENINLIRTCKSTSTLFVRA